RLMTNNPRKVAALEAAGVDVVERIALHTNCNPHNEKYLQTKGVKLGHLFEG
ncbi:MAG: GTP cyclohydrolase II, partial [Parahaliea sp.]